MDRANGHVHLHLDWGRSPESWRNLVNGRRVWDDDPYGYSAIGEYYSLSYSEDVVESSLVTLLRRILGKLLGMDLVHAWRNRRVLADADVVITHTEHEFLAVLAINRIFRNSTTKTICQAVWLWDRWDQLSPLRQRCYEALMRDADVLTVLSGLNRDIAHERTSKTPVVMVPFGVRPLPARLSPPSGAGRLRIVAPGNDRDRDWTLLARASIAASFDVRVRSRRRRARKAFSSTSADVRPATSIDEYWSDLDWCDVVVVPLRDNLHASGVTVALEAISAGRPVVIADVGGLRDYFGESVFFYRPGDKSSLIGAVRAAAAEGPRAASSSSVQPFLEKFGLRAEDYARRHVLLVDALLTGSAISEAVSAFTAPCPVLSESES